MNKKELLNRYNTWYTNNKKQIDIEYDLYIKESSYFLSLFGTEKQLNEMTIKQYAFQTKGNKDAFCFIIDFKTSHCGVDRNVHQPGYERYGFQYTKNGSDWYPKHSQKESRYGDDPETIFNHFKKEIIKLFRITKSNDIDKIDMIDMPSQFVNKLHFLYSKNNSIPIYSKEHCIKLLKELGKEYQDDHTTFFYRRELLDYFHRLKQSGMTPWHFMTFVYSKEGFRDILKVKNNNQPHGFHGAIKNRELDLHTPVQQYEDADELRKIGKEGERIVYEYLSNNREKEKIKEGTDIIKVCEMENTSDHCDYIYTDINDDTIYVEVKATIQNKPNEFHLRMSAYEYEFMKIHKKHYKLYYVNDVFGDYSISIIRPNQLIDKMGVFNYYLDGIKETGE